MRVRARLTTATAGPAMALAMVTSLSGCMTVHGERAVVPAASEAEAQRAFERYVETSNEAVRDFDAELNATVESGPLGAIRNAELTARHEVTPEGNEQFTPLEVSDTRYLIPQQAGWPKFFAVDTQTNQSPDNRWLMIFTRNSVEEEWTASYLTLLPSSGAPRFAQDDDGYLEELPVAGDTHTGLSLEPGEVSTAYADYLSGGAGPFTEGPFTTDVLTAREGANSDPAFITEFQDQAAEDAPVAIRTEDGGAFVVFASLHHEKRTMAPGETLEVDPLVAALMEDTAEQTLTMERVAMQAALVPEGDGEVEILNRVPGVVSASGE